MLIAGPTASGKSALALAIAESIGGEVVNADSMQVYDGLAVLSARPSAAEMGLIPHHLYGFVPSSRAYSVGEWLTEVSALSGRLIVVGGTGLYLNALTRGLAVIPATPAEIRATADRLRATPEGLGQMVAGLDAPTRARIDLQNPVRVQRAWEVLTATGRGIVEWQAETPPPLIAPESAHLLVLQSERDWLAGRIARRFHLMIEQGAVDEVRAMLPRWDAEALWAKAIGAADLVAYLQGYATLDEAIERAIIASRQYAKAQRSFFRGRMRDWNWVGAAT